MGSYGSDNFYPTFDKKINVLKNVTLARHSSAESELPYFYPTFDKKSKTANSTENCRQRSANLLQSPNTDLRFLCEEVFPPPKHEKRRKNRDPSAHISVRAGQNP